MLLARRRKVRDRDRRGGGGREREADRQADRQTDRQILRFVFIVYAFSFKIFLCVEFLFNGARD